MPHDRDPREEVERIVVDWRERRDRGERVTPEEVIRSHPDLAEQLQACFQALAVLDLALRKRGRRRH